MKYALHALESSLKSNRIDTRRWNSAGGSLLVSVHAARLLGCTMPGVEGNLFWHHPDLEDAFKARNLLASGGGFGGDRLWIAPEVGFIFTDLKKSRKDPITYGKLPPAMDPASWRVTEECCGHLGLRTKMKLADHRTGKKIALDVARVFSVLEPYPVPAGVHALSFAIRNEVTCTAGDAGAVAGAWDLLQVPPTGWLVCPTVAPVEAPRSYYDPYGSRHVKCDKTSVRFLIDGKHRIKMGIPAQQTTGRMGYYRKLGKVSVLIVRVFAPLPGETYVDLPRSSNAMFGGDALQAYNDDGTFGGFGEMEYHDPALVAGRHPRTQIGSCVTHVLTGSDAKVKKLGTELLGVRL